MSPMNKDCVEYLLPDYKNSTNTRASYQNVPIELLPYVREYFKAQGKKIRVRFRGPRNDPRDNRPLSNRKQDCLKRFANRFHVYFE
jgi:hypothetical protein